MLSNVGLVKGEFDDDTFDGRFDKAELDCNDFDGDGFNSSGVNCEGVDNGGLVEGAGLSLLEAAEVVEDFADGDLLDVAAVADEGINAETVELADTGRATLEVGTSTDSCDVDVSVRNDTVVDSAMGPAQVVIGHVQLLIAATPGKSPNGISWPQ